MYNYNLRNDYYNYNNNNYNQPTYTEDANPNKLYDPYQGFIRGNMFKNLYNDYKLKNPIDFNTLSEQEQMLIMIDSLGFAASDISLYLTLYSNDRDMIELFNQYRNQLKAISREYEEMYGPLTLSSDALNRYPWSYNNEPWPWEN